MSKITYIATGDANHYTLMRDSKWLATMQFNGELLVPAQESLLGGMIAGIPGQADPGSIKERAAQLVVDMSEMADLHAGNGDTPAAEEFSQGAELVRTMAAEIERLQAVEGSVVAMAAMLNEREWAEHAGKGAASELESAITNLHNELAEARKDAERFQFFAAVAVSDELHDAFEPHMPTDVETPEDIDGVREHMDICIQSVKDAGLWPIKPEPQLTDEAQADRDDFEAYKDESGGCRCHLNPPCGYCTHPGNPVNQEDPSCWKVLP